VSIDLGKLENAPRVLIEVALKPVAGTRIQPTGFPDLGPAVYDAPEGKDGTVSTLLVESAQSMANRLEAVCWDEATNDIVPELKGLPFIRVKLAGIGDGTDTTCSLLEFHRLNSPYIMQKKKDTTRSYTPKKQWFTELFTREIGGAIADTAATAGNSEGDEGIGVVNLRRLASACFKFDPNSLIHGVFLEKIAGRLRHPRALSAFIEASEARRADSGGVKFDRALPSPKGTGLGAEEGFGNVPFHRTEFTARSITAFFSIDLAQVRGYGLSAEAAELLIVLSLWKIRRFLDSNMRLRSACELEMVEGADGIRAKRPHDFALPAAPELATRLAELIAQCKPHFANPAVTELTWNKLTGKE
jgi:CRISPR-associated protein Csb1